MLVGMRNSSSFNLEEEQERSLLGLLIDCFIRTTSTTNMKHIEQQGEKDEKYTDRCEN